MDWLPPYFVLFIPIIFPAWWIVIMCLIAFLGGWRRLAKTYAARAEPSGEKLRFQSMRLGLTRYNGALTFVFAAQGLYMAAWGIFRPGHTPLLIPWSDIRYAGAKKIVWVTFEVFEIKANPPVTLQLLPKVAAKLQPHLSGAP